MDGAVAVEIAALMESVEFLVAIPDGSDVLGIEIDDLIEHNRCHIDRNHKIIDIDTGGRIHVGEVITVVDATGET